MNEIVIEKKAEIFYTALQDPYFELGDRDLSGYAKITPSEDFAEDLTAMLIAMKDFFEEVTDCTGEHDLIGFTYLLNRVAVNFVLHTPRERK